MIFVLFILLGLIASGKPFCFHVVLVSFEASNGPTSHHCMYRGLRLELEDHTRTEDCIECHCDLTGLSCCGYGIKAGVIQPPAGFQVLADGCTPIIVKAHEKTKDCHCAKKFSFLKKSLMSSIGENR